MIRHYLSIRGFFSIVKPFLQDFLAFIGAVSGLVFLIAMHSGDLNNLFRVS